MEIRHGLVTLAEAVDAPRFGGKAAALARACAAGLAVPRGLALDSAFVQAVANGDRAALAEMSAVASSLRAPLAVRSSAIGEDSADDSFAGQHLTRLGVSVDGLALAVREVLDSLCAPAALAYRARRGIEGAIRGGVIVQELVAAEVAAVVFTRDPVSGSDCIVIEASHGLGESVVSGAVIPDRFVLDARGRIIERSAGDKDTALLVVGGIVVDVRIDDQRREALCLDEARLARIYELVKAVDAVWLGPHDLEVAFAGNELYLLQRRPLTTG